MRRSARFIVCAALVGCGSPRAFAGLPVVTSGPVKQASEPKGFGKQADPGAAGDGTFEQPKPYPSPSETLTHPPGVAVGRLSESAKYASPRVYPGYSFEYWLYVPAQYDPKRPAALMVFQDGIHYVGLTEAKFNSAITFDNLIAAGEMPPTIALFINPGTPSGTYHYPEEQGIRSVEYDSLDDAYSRFLLEEIIPDVVTSHFQIVKDPEGWGIGGHSSGGICAFTVAFRHPDRFRKVLTHNGSFVAIKGGNVYPQLLRTEAVRPLRVSLLSGTDDVSNEHGNWLEANRAMAEALAERHYHYRFMSGEGGHYPPLQAVNDYPAALRWLWRGYTPQR